MISTLQDSFRARSPSTAACNSIRLFVVCGSEPYSSRSFPPNRRMHAQPPGPGLPIHDPSVMSWTFFISPSGGDCLELSLEKSVDMFQNLSSFGVAIDFRSQPRSIADAVCKICRELFHLAHCVRHGAIAKHAVIGANDVIALVLGRMVVGSGLDILLNLAEDPWIRRSGPADHNAVAT